MIKEKEQPIEFGAYIHALRKEKKYSETEVPTPKLAIGPRKQKGSKSGKSSKGRKRTVIIM